MCEGHWRLFGFRRCVIVKTESLFIPKKKQVTWAKYKSDQKRNRRKWLKDTRLQLCYFGLLGYQRAKGRQQWCSQFRSSEWSYFPIVWLLKTSQTIVKYLMSWITSSATYTAMLAPRGYTNPVTTVRADASVTFGCWLIVHIVVCSVQ